VYAVRPLLQLFASAPTQTFTVQALKLVRDRMVQTGLARNTVNSRVGRIVHMFRWGCEEALVPASVYHELRVLRALQRGRSKARETEPRRPVARERVEATLPHVSRQIAGIVELMWWSGMRPSEALAVRLADIDRTGDLWEYKLRYHKTLHHGKERVVILGPKARAVLRPFLMRVPAPDPESPLFSASEAEAERNAQRRKDRVTSMKPSDGSRMRKRAERTDGRKVGDSYTVASLRRAVERACKEAKVPHWTPHQLRHAAATRIRQAAGVEAASLVLGHSNLATTEIYAEASMERTRQIMRELG
jgi:integrase